MFDLLRLSRPINLLIIALTLVAVRCGIVAGNLERGLTHLLATMDGTGRADLILPPGFGPQLPLSSFILLGLSTVLIAAAGNIINDYFDTRIDRINRPHRVIVGRSVERRVAMTAHLVLSIAGLVSGAFVAWRHGMWHWAVIPAFSIMSLWVYSTSWKRRLIVGNVLVALLTALVPLTAGLYEITLMERSFADPWSIRTMGGAQYIMDIGFIRELWGWVLAYAAFAFLSTLVREVQKDMADVKGDRAAGCRTVPIAWGMRWARTLALVHTGIIVAGLLMVRAVFLRDSFSFWYIGIGIIGPLLLSAGFTYQASDRAEHVRAGNLMKLAMVMAVAFAFLIRYLP